jgi:hypothetical protein
MFSRREMLRIAAVAIAAHGAGSRLCRADAILKEEQKGDPDDVYEHVNYDPGTIAKLATKPASKAVFEPWQKNLPDALIMTARSFLGCSRSSTPGQITQFLELFGLTLRDRDGYVAYCAAGISFAALTAYANALGKLGNDEIKRLQSIAPDLEHYYFYPTVSCVDMWNIAKGKRHWIQHTRGASNPTRGWIVLYDWGNRGTPDHCGIVQHATDQEIKTLEFNTTAESSGSQRNGGAVAEKSRPYDHVLGFIVTDAAPK